MRRLQVVQYVGAYYLLTDWIVEGNMEKRVWVSNVGRQNAAVILTEDTTIKIVLYAPNGDVIDVSAVLRKCGYVPHSLRTPRQEAFRIAREMLQVFYEDAKVVITKAAPDFRDWLDL